MIRFVTDGMLGRFTRWLRILGYDVSYNPTLSDDGLLTLAETQHRVLLTRDRELYQRAQRRGLTSLYLTGSTVQEKLVEVGRRFSLSFQLDATVSRCARCGALLQHVDKTVIRGEIPAGTFHHYSAFWRCTECGKVYWRGSHWNRIAQAVTQVTNLLKEPASMM